MAGHRRLQTLVCFLLQSRPDIFKGFFDMFYFQHSNRHSIRTHERSIPVKKEEPRFILKQKHKFIRQVATDLRERRVCESF